MFGKNSLVFLLLKFIQVLSVGHGCHHLFTETEGYLCINSQYVESLSGINSVVDCAFHCKKSQRCRAFSLADGPCKLFVFDACSKSVRDCRCSRRGRLFVKRLPGLEPGALCPPGYGNNMCGVKYRFNEFQATWRDHRQACETNQIGGDLVIMADVTDMKEMDHLDALYNSSGLSFWLAGYQMDGSVQPLGGWHWVGCDLVLDPKLWGTGEPNNLNLRGENAVCRGRSHPALADAYEMDATRYGLCECLSPFD